MKDRLLNIILSPFFLALILAATIILLLPPLFNKYKAEVLIKNLQTPKVDFLGYFEDLDKDGLSEFVHFKYNRFGNGAFTLRNNKMKTFRQWNLPGKFKLGNRSFIIGDCDDNNLKEIYSYYYRSDSLFIGYCEPFNKEDPEIKSVFVDLIQLVDGVPDFDCYFSTLHDFNKDGTKEVLFCILGRFSLQPRNAYLFDPVSQSITKSPRSYSVIFVHQIMDIDGDGIDELFTATNSNGNVLQETGYPYHDSSAWAMIFTPDLNFKFEPIEFPGTQITVQIYPFIGDTANYIILFIKRVNKVSIINSEVHIFDDHFSLIKTYYPDSVLDGFNNQTISFFLNNYFYIMNGLFGKAIKLNGDLSFSSISNSTVDFSNERLLLDIDFDGQDEVVSFQNDGITIFRDQFANPVSLKIPLDFDHNLRSISSYKDNSGVNKFYLQRGWNNYLISYGKNPFYFLKYPFYFGIYLVCLVFILLIRRLQQYQLNQKQKITDKITALQLHNIKSQFDPHFMFNVINSISYAVHKSDKETANQYISELSEFVRGIVTDSEKISRPLADELKLVSNYLMIEKLRFRNRFDFQIEKGGVKVSSLQIPKNLVLTFVENAVKHGIRPLKEDGLINIEVKQSQNSTLITIDDNGVGRNTAGSDSDNTGKGMSIVKQILDLYFQLYKKRITYEINDKLENGKPAGTKVVISIP